MIKSLTYFQNTKLPAAVAQLFKDLDVPLNLTGETAAEIGDLLEKNSHPRFAEYVGDVYWVGQVDDNAFEGITSPAAELTKIRGKSYDTILVFALEIRRENGLLPTRTQLFDLARAFNREFPYQPVVLVFRYSGHLISVAVVERNDYKVKHLEGDKIGKMSLLRDVDTRSEHTHAGHLRILQDMQIPRSGKNAVTTFETLYRYWQQALNVSILNKKFYQELSNWYFWAVHHVRFPGEPQDLDIEQLKTHRASNVIRLITRLIFSWFLKEKNLVPSTLFDLEELTDQHLKIVSLTPDSSEGSEYYLAILQNLFFATLNQEMNDRRFKTDTRVFPHPDHSIKNIYRYAELFKNADRAAELFKNIPFLNGGLFECLDDEQHMIDGFSETKSKQPSVPNYLFFQKSTAVSNELNEDYGTKNKKYEVRGLINILNDYKFTIAENTPLEEEVALDPELLGRIFENLLASYNPETKTTARKQTGSFYTPREIVNYMVDESLIAYLKNKLTENHAGSLELGKSQIAMFGDLPNKKGQISLETQPNTSKWKGKEEELEQNLRLLFSYTDIQPFTDSKDIEALIAALDQCKVLDPACGSGAFPMGILHRMVVLLHKLDPQNTRWKERQIQKAESMEDSTARQDALDAIDRAFQHNELDYGRKLFLIENCIYGVDIQPVAVQIAKLRFFISLICEQNSNDTAENRGILSLPNLETKFVAANTLIGLENATLAKQAVVDLLEERETLHHRMFSAKRYSDKKRFREKDKKLRVQIKDKLESTGWVSNDVSSQLANWNPFDQNTSAPFFEPQWMFGIEEGFDVVIGNPPYVQLQKIKEQALVLQKQGFKTFEKTGDLYCLFYEKSVSLSKKVSGLTTFITSNKWMKSGYGENLRHYFTSNCNPIILIDFGSQQIFETATVDTNILVLENKTFKNDVFTCKIDQSYLSIGEFGKFVEDNGITTTSFSKASWAINSGENAAILSKIEKSGKKLKQFNIKIFRGILTGFDEAFIIDKETREKFIRDSTINSILKPILKGKDIFKFECRFQDRWLINAHNGYTNSKGERLPPIDIEKKFPSIFTYFRRFESELNKRDDQGAHWTNLRNCAYIEEFMKPKIVWGNLNLEARFAIDTTGMFINAPTNMLTSVNDDILYLGGVLNSKITTWMMRQIGYSREHGYVEYKKIFVEQLTIPIPTKSQKKVIEIIVKIIILQKSNPDSATYTFERILDGLVFELYFSELMKEKEIDILTQVERDLAPYGAFESQSEVEKAASIEALHRLWTHPDSVVRNRLALMAVRSPDVLGVILEGK